MFLLLCKDVDYVNFLNQLNNLIVDKSKKKNAATGKPFIRSKEASKLPDSWKERRLQSREDDLETENCSCSRRLLH